MELDNELGRHTAVWCSQPHRLLVSSFHGILSSERFRAWTRDLLALPGFDPAFDHLIDLARVETIEFEGRDFAILAQDDAVVRTGKRAIVAPTNLLFGISRTAAGWMSNTRPDTQVFREIDSALEWIGRPPETLLELGRPAIVY
jgi:hypothetical protein